MEQRIADAITTAIAATIQGALFGGGLYLLLRGTGLIETTWLVLTGCLLVGLVVGRLMVAAFDLQRIERKLDVWVRLGGAR